MARETKLGMLVGLGFIICFAIILENRGRRDRVAVQMPHEVLTQSPTVSSPVTPTVAEQRARDYGRRAGRRRAAESEQVAADSPPASRRRGSRRHRSEQSRPTGQDAPTDSPGAQAAANDAPAVSGRNTIAAQPSVEERSTAPPTEPAVVEATPSVPDRRQTSLTATGSAQPTDLGRPPARQAASERPMRRHTVQQGENLSRIAAGYYGTRAKRVIDAIFDANRATLSSPDELKIGQKLALPEIDGVGQPSAEAGSAPVTDRADPPPSEQEPEHRYYQVKKGDRYATIAREHLGDARRWREIAELNRDIFTDPSKIRYGVRIRLPAGSDGGAAGERS